MRGAMSDIFSVLLELGTSHDWLVMANFSLSVLLCLWMLRYRRLYMAARDERENYRNLLGNLSEGVYRASLDGRLLWVNRALAELNGYDNEEMLLAAVRNKSGEWYIEAGRGEAFRATVNRDGMVTDFVSEVRRHKTRERIWISESARLVRSKKTGKPLFYEGSVREITETVKRLRLEEMFQKLTTQLPGGLFQLVRRPGGKFSIPYISNGFRRLSGLVEDDAFPKPEALLDFIHQEDRERFQASLRRSGMEMTHWNCEFRAGSRDGTEKWLRVSASPEAIEGGIIWHGYLADISERKRHEMRVERLAFYDPLTRLPNRRLFLERITRIADNAGESGEHGALLYVDLDNFKTLNDTMGHHVGDDFLVQVASRLSRCVRSQDTVARIGGDEFVIVLEDLGRDNAAASRNAIVAANKVLGALSEEFDLGYIRHKSTASIGVVVFDQARPRTDEILKNADMAMYEAKATGRNGIALFDPSQMNREADRFRLVSELRAAIEDSSLQLEFQPQIDRSGHVSGAEALVRWPHPERGRLLAGAFVPVAEQYGLSEALTELVLDMAGKTLAAWSGNPATANLSMAVNVAVSTINSDRFVLFLRDLIARYRIEPARLTLEVKEDIMSADAPTAARHMNEIKALGVRLSLDNFGRGYSSLAFLKKMPFDELKVDGSFVADIEKSDGDCALVKTILAMAHALGLTSVAEHVETAEQDALLRDFGCDYLQGWHYSPALSQVDFVNYVAKRNPEGMVVTFPKVRQNA